MPITNVDADGDEIDIEKYQGSFEIFGYENFLDRVGLEPLQSCLRRQKNGDKGCMDRISRIVDRG